MSQASYTIDGNQNGAAYTTAINAALLAAATLNAGAAAPAQGGSPSQPFPYMVWADTTTGLLKVRDSTNSFWIAWGKLSGLVGNGLASGYVGKVLDADRTQYLLAANVLSVEGVYVDAPSFVIDAQNSNGANGLDTGTLAASTWYAVHIICSPDAGLKAGLISLSATTPSMPSGYTKRRRVGWLRTVGANNAFIPMTQIGGRATWDDDDGGEVALVVSAQNVPFASGTYGVAGWANQVPPGTVRAYGQALIDVAVANATKGAVFMRPQGSTRRGRIIGGCWNQANVRGGGPFEIDLSAGLQSEYARTAVSGAASDVLLTVAASGWDDPAVS